MIIVQKFYNEALNNPVCQFIFDQKFKNLPHIYKDEVQQKQVLGTWLIFLHGPITLLPS